MDIRHIIICLILLLPCLPAGASTLSKENQQALQQLDALLQRSDDLEQQKLQRIESLKAKLDRTTGDEERFWVAKSIFDEYQTFDGDSALYYGKRILEMAEHLNRPDLQDEIRIVASTIYTAIGLLDEGKAELEKVDPDGLSNDLKIRYMRQQIYLISHENQYKKINSEVEMLPDEGKAVLDSLMKILPPSHPEYYRYLAYQAMGDPDQSQQVLDRVLPVMDNLGYESQSDATLAWMVARLYDTLGDEQGKVYFLIRSAIADMQIANREIASLEELAVIMDRYGELQRAYDYVDHCMVCAERFKNRVRMLRVASLQNEIHRHYHDRFVQLHRADRTHTWLTIIFALILLATCVYIYLQRRKLARSYDNLAKAKVGITDRLEELSTTYSQLADNNQQMLEMQQRMQQANASLEESDRAKARCIGEMLEACSQYLDKVEAFRRSMLRLLKSSQYDKALLLAQDRDDEQAMLKEYYKKFDETFLSVYPNFVEDFNHLLQPDQQILPKEDGRLNTELRIYALIHLGITDSARIADILHCSVQTIYNKRMKTRNKAILSKDTFDYQVENIGKS
ncbi:MAG: DUF6377 domain-containing protein [Bacteroidales bacterium]|nr:DUF6377 domain-containing protein [Bacteroidales bacterium]MCD8393451.1 DUF6377 domain-containing protein [Bacteroidales bacterium]